MQNAAANVFDGVQLEEAFVHVDERHVAQNVTFHQNGIMRRFVGNRPVRVHVLDALVRVPRRFRPARGRERNENLRSTFVLPGQRAIVQLETNGDETRVHRVFVVENQRRAVPKRMVERDERREGESRTEAFGGC